MSKFDNKYKRTPIRQVADTIIQQEKAEENARKRFGAPSHPICPFCNGIMDNPLFQRRCQWCGMEIGKEEKNANEFHSE